jgi:uncharacterized membrane protein
MMKKNTLYKHRNLFLLPKESIMISSRMKFSLAVLLIAGTSAVVARPGSHEVREAVRDVHQYGRSEQGSSRDVRQFENSRSGDNAYSGTDGSRRGGRMSPEDRRALRQQINEAGQDIYNPKRR